MTGLDQSQSIPEAGLRPNSGIGLPIRRRPAHVPTRRQCWRALNQQSLRLQVEARPSWPRVVDETREIRTLTLYEMFMGQKQKRCVPFHVDAFGRHTNLLASGCGPPVKGGAAWGVGRMVCVFNRGIVGSMRLLCCRYRVHNDASVGVRYRRKSFATRNQCRVEPECRPSQNQHQVCRSTATQG